MTLPPSGGLAPRPLWRHRLQGGRLFSIRRIQEESGNPARVGERIADVSRRVVQQGAGVTWGQGADGRVTVRRRRYGAVRAKLVGLLGEPADFTVRLDPLGSAAWLLIDGRRTVGELRVELQRSHPLEPDIAARLGKFVGTMVSHDMVRLL